MTTRRNYIFTKKYIPPQPPTDLKWYEQDLETYFTKTKYRQVTDNPDYYFKNVKFIDFDIFTMTLKKQNYKSQLRNTKKFLKVILRTMTLSLVSTMV